MNRFSHVSKFGLLLLFSLLRGGATYGQDWIPASQRNPVPGQTRIFYNACTDERAFVSDNTKKWAQSAVRAGQQVTLRLVGVNPFYKQTIKFDKASFSWKTPEPENFQWITMKSTTGSEKSDTPKEEKGNLGVLPSKGQIGVGSQVTGAGGLVTGQISALKALKVTIKNKAAVDKDIALLTLLQREAARIENETASSYQDLVKAESQVSDAFSVLESIVSFQNSLTISPCLTLEEYTRQETTLFTSLTAYLGDPAVVSNAGTLANAFRHSIEAYPNMYDLIKISQLRLQKDVDNLRAQIESLSMPDSKSAAEALADEMDSTLKVFSGILDDKASTVDTLKSQLAGEEGKKLTRTCQTLLNNKTFFTIPFVLGPFSPDRNANEISVAATATRPSADGKGESTDVSLIGLKLPVVNNLQIDFTTGGLFSSMGDNAYVVRTTPSSTTATPDTYTIQTNKNSGGFVLATQANLIWQTSPSFGWGANVGIGVDVVNNQSARYMTGLSAKLGGLSDNLLLSAGVIFGKVKRLSAEMASDVTYQKQIEPKTYDKFEAGLYVGVSYVLGSKKINK